MQILQAVQRIACRTVRKGNVVMDFSCASTPFERERIANPTKLFMCMTEQRRYKYHLDRPGMVQVNYSIRLQTFKTKNVIVEGIYIKIRTSRSWILGQLSSGQIKELRYVFFSSTRKKTEAAALSHVGTHHQPKFRLTISPLFIQPKRQFSQPTKSQITADFQHIYMYGNNERTNKQILEEQSII
jgi:hypothetical protein